MRHHHLLLPLAAAVAAAPAASAQVVDSIDWPSFLSRSDPIWSFSSNVTCSQGYTELPQTIKHEPAPGCEGVQCSSPETCVEESASQCDACEGCTSFGLCPVWHNASLPQLFGNVTAYIANPDWTTFVKGGPDLRNHSSCARTGTPTPVAWEDSAFFGNGLTGGLLRVETSGTGGPIPNVLRVDLGRTDVWDRRAPGSQHAVGNTMFDRPRLPVGYLHLTTRGNITAGSWRVHLLNATIAGSVTTTEGNVSFLLLSHYTRIATLLAWSATGGEAPSPADGTGGFSVTFVPLPGNSTRQNPPPTYVPNPAPTCNGASGWGPASSQPRVCTQELLAGSNYATALLTAALPSSASPSYVYLTTVHTANDFPAASSNATAAQVVSTTSAAAVASLSAVLAEHAGWWAAFWPSSFLSLPDTSLEATWVLQMYKLACAARAGGPAIDLMGPWWQKSGWELYWLDLNVQMSYWPAFAAAKFDVAETLPLWLVQNVSQIFANPSWPPPNNASWTDSAGISGTASYDAISTFVVSPGQQLGNLPWLMHDLYMHATYRADDAFLADKLFPILRGAVNLYRHFSFVGGEDGRIHLPPTASPEYPYPHGPTNDTNYDLALFLWGATTLLELANATGNGADPLVPYWRSVLATLTPSPADPVHGLNVSLGVGFDIPHRHFSHLFSIYPLHVLPFSAADGGTPATQSLIGRSLDRWSGLTCGGGSTWGCPNGFTYVGVASISALMGADGDDSRRAAAVGNLSSFVRSGLMHSSTLYSEGHEPCIESPLGFASSLMEILLQSWGGRVRVFPAVPSAWADAVIHDLAAEGGFRVSAVRAGGKTAWVGVRAVNYTAAAAAALKAGSAAASSRTIVLAPGDMAGPYATVPAGVPVTVLPSGDLSFPVPVGPEGEQGAAWVVVYPASVVPPPTFSVQALPGNASEYNFWGMH